MVGDRYSRAGDTGGGEEDGIADEKKGLRGDGLVVLLGQRARWRLGSG